MPLDPVLERVLPKMPGLIPGAPDVTPQEARAHFRHVTIGMRRPGDIVPVASVEDLEVDGAEGPIRARVYRPHAEGPRPTIVFFHGGGFVIGDLDTHDDHARLLCRDVGAAVLSIEYRLAPEHPWPAGVEDCVAATRWAAANVERLGGDPARIAVAGDSAGGNLSAVVAQVLRDEGGPALAAQLLLYPVTDHAGGADDHPSRRENAHGYFLNVDDMRWCDRHYTAGASDRATPRLSPLRGELAGLPPAVVVTAEFDPLRDEGDAYAAALERAGVRVIHLSSPGMIHGFFGLGVISPGAAEAIRRASEALRELLPD